MEPAVEKEDVWQDIGLVEGIPVADHNGGWLVAVPRWSVLSAGAGRGNKPTSKRDPICRVERNRLVVKTKPSGINVGLKGEWTDA